MNVEAFFLFIGRSRELNLELSTSHPHPITSEPGLTSYVGAFEHKIFITLLTLQHMLCVCNHSLNPATYVVCV